jgi:hypothetical protein
MHVLFVADARVLLLPIDGPLSSVAIHIVRCWKKRVLTFLGGIDLELL